MRFLLWLGVSLIMIFKIVKKELKDILRDNKIVVFGVLFPLIFMPLVIGMIMFMTNNFAYTDEEIYSVIGFAFEPDETMNTIIEEMNIKKVVGTRNELAKKYDLGELVSFITLDYNKYTVYYSEMDMNGYASAELANTMLESYIKVRQAQNVMAKGLSPEEILNIAEIEIKDVSETDVSAMGDMVTSFIPTFILIAIALMSGFASVDMIAGEKERGTLETLLTFPLKKEQIITGKFISSCILTIVCSLMAFVAMYLTAFILSRNLGAFDEIKLLSIGEFMLLIISFVVYGIFINSIAVALASTSKSVMEGQMKSSLLNFVSMIPMFMNMLQVKINYGLSFIPVINISLILNSIIHSEFNIGYFVVMIVSNLVFAIIVIKIISKLYKSDKVLFG